MVRLDIETTFPMVITSAAVAIEIKSRYLPRSPKTTVLNVLILFNVRLRSGRVYD
jgi:hypothetical protein